MENRWVSRKPIDCEVRLLSPRGAVCRTHARNISLGGMYVAAPSRKLPVDSLVELDFTLHAQGRTMHHHIPAQIVHESDEGIGIMFCDFNSATVKSMRSMLYSG